MVSRKDDLKKMTYERWCQEYAHKPASKKKMQQWKKACRDYHLRRKDPKTGFLMYRSLPTRPFGIHRNRGQ